MRLKRRRGPSAQVASCPPAARSYSSPKRRRICSSRRRRISEVPSPNQKRMRLLQAPADMGRGPNQKSRTVRASSTARARFRAARRLFACRLRLVSGEQLLQLRCRCAGGDEEFLLVLLDRVLRLQRLLIVLAKATYGLARGGCAHSERLQHRLG